MLFNLGLTADAAAAHKHDFSPNTMSGPESSSLSDLSFVRLPALRLGQILNRAKSPFVAEVSQPMVPEVPAERGLAVDSPDTQSMSDDGEGSPVETVQSPVRSKLTSTRKAPRRKTAYQLAHPAGTARPKRLRLRPKLLLQVQRVSSAARPVPVVDVLPSTIFLPGLARRFPSIFRGKNGLGPNDLIVMISEFYQQTTTAVHATAAPSDKEDDENREVVATICQLPREDTRAGGLVEICLNDGQVWEGSRLPTGSYEFVARTKDGDQTLRWVSRITKHRRLSSSQREESKRLTFSVIDPSTRRHPVIASLTRNQMEVYDEYSIPSPSASHPAPVAVSSPTSVLSTHSDSSETEWPVGKNGVSVTTDDNLRALIIITGIWVAFKEGWSHNFSYDESTPSVNSKSTAGISSPSSLRSLPFSPSSSTRDHAGDDEEVDGLSDLTVNSGHTDPPFKQISRVRRSQTLSTSGSYSALSSTSGRSSPSQRSNSIGAAFLENSNRKSGGRTSARSKRHSMFSAPHEVADEEDGAASTKVKSQAKGSSTRSRHSMIAYPSARIDETSDTEAAERPDVTLPESSGRPTLPSINGETKTLRSRAIETTSTLTPTPGKRRIRHRLSGIFDMFGRKGSSH